MAKLGLLGTVICAAVLGLVFLAPAQSSEIDTSLGRLSLTTMAKGLDEPWGLAFLPDGGFLVTERDGRLRLFGPEGGKGVSLGGLPEVETGGQGGLLDVMVPQDFATSRAVYLSFSKANGALAGTAMGRGYLSADGQTLDRFETLFADPIGGESGIHYGSRIVESRDGTLFLTMGERGEGALAQDVTRANGKVVHLTRDGAPAEPAQAGRFPGLYSYGHRNPQGAALDAGGQLWVVEHGAQGGDELNRVEQGRNYGWPVITYGKDYDDSKIGIGTEAPGMEQPVMYWDPSIAPSGLMFYTGAMFPEWQGDVFTGSLKFDYLSRLDPDTAYAEERISGPQTGRVRDVRQAPDGAIWFLSVIDGAVYRIAR